MKVKLISYTPEPEKVVSAAAKLCYSNVGIDDIMDKLTDENVDKFLNMLMSYGHASPIEHVNFTFAIEDVSRALTHQLVRHRIASYSQQSQRYVDLKDTFKYITPPAISSVPNIKNKYDMIMNTIFEQYVELSKLLLNEYVSNGMKHNKAIKKAIEDARYVLPNSCETKIVFTMNARTLLNFLNHRCCQRAQWEIREVAWEIRRQLIEVAPIIFKKSGPSCIKGKCPEGSMSCGDVNIMKKKAGVVNE